MSGDRIPRERTRYSVGVGLSFSLDTGVVIGTWANSLEGMYGILSLMDGSLDSVSA